MENSGNNQEHFERLQEQFTQPQPDNPVISEAMNLEIYKNITGESLERHTPISSEEITDLKIILETTDDVLKFMEQVW